MYEIEFKVPIYYYKIKLVLCDKVTDYFEDITDSEDEAIVIPTPDKDSTCDCILIFTNGNITGGLISHEAFHILCLIMRNRGFTLSESSEEACAYLIGWLHKAILLNLIKLKQLFNEEVSDKREKILKTATRSTKMEKFS